MHKSCDALLMDAQIKLSKEEYVGDMVQRRTSNDAVVKDAQIMLKREECARGMEQRSNDAAVKDARTNL